VFFDDFETTALWGRDLAVHFDAVYRTVPRFVVPFVSQAYASKAWAQHEFRSALATAVESAEPYSCRRFDRTELPGLRPTIHYLDGTQAHAGSRWQRGSVERLESHHSPLRRLRGGATPASPAAAELQPVRRSGARR